MDQETIYHCTECGKELKLQNRRTEKNPDGSVNVFVDAWCVNEDCSRKNQLTVIDLTPRGSHK